jgi:hypothetical protein
MTTQHETHFCHWPSCRHQVPARLWGCKKHWFTLPEMIRHRISRAYRQGQEIDKTPSLEYIAVAREAQEWIQKYEAEQAALADDAQREMLGSDADFDLGNVGFK